MTQLILFHLHRRQSGLRRADHQPQQETKSSCQLALWELEKMESRASCVFLDRFSCGLIRLFFCRQIESAARFVIHATSPSKHCFSFSVFFFSLYCCDVCVLQVSIPLRSIAINMGLCNRSWRENGVGGATSALKTNEHTARCATVCNLSEVHFLP